MKRYICFVFSIFLFLSFFSYSYAETDYDFVSSHYSLFLDGRFVPGAFGNPFDFDTLFIDIFFIDNPQKAYLCISERFSDIFISTGMSTVSVAERNGNIYFAYENGEYLTGHYDENGTDLWIDYKGNSFRLCPVHPFDPTCDWQ